ncbi:MAG TPA: ATP-binding protein, partial [Nitrosopumilaceae archaeon]|nr:ATP-binding protein [Nitrosopumilaceae archaeon]
TIRSSAEIIKRNSKTDDNELTEVIARMDRAIDRIAHQIEDVLNFVRTTPLDISDVSMQSVFQSSIKSLEIPQNISIELPRIDFTIRGDFRKLEVVFINLILNAVQAIGKDQGKIIIRMIKENGDLKINVEDTGPGIPNEIFPKIFDPLITTKERGTGLGLSTCKNIIEQHGGTISAKNTPTTFIMRLPENVI